MIPLFYKPNPEYRDRAILMNGALIKHFTPRMIPAPCNDNLVNTVKR